MVLRRRIYARSVAERLKAEIAAAPEGVIVMSPYLTSDTAEQVINLARQATIYTTFETETFASGSSSLATLRQLQEAGHSLFHVDRLHAKIVITDRIACLGSQNLTRGGSLNLEASVILDDSAAVAHLRLQVTPWIQRARLITAEMIAHLAEQLPELRKAFLKLRRKAVAVDEAAWSGQAERDAEIRREVKEERRRQLRETRIQRALRAKRDRLRRETTSPLITSSDAMLASLETRGTTGELILGMPRYYSYQTLKLIRSSPEDSFLRWWMWDGRWRKLRKTQRRLVLNCDSTALAWAAMFGTQLSKFGVRLQETEPIDIGEHTFALAIAFAEEPSDLAEWNVRFELAPWPRPGQPRPRSPGSTFFCRFLGFQLELVRANHEREDLGFFFERDVLADAVQKLRARLLNAFKYEWNSLGKSPTEFLVGSRGDRFRLRLHEIEGQDMLRPAYLTIERLGQAVS